MADGIGDALVGLMGVAITAKIAGDVLKSTNRNVPRTKYKKIKPVKTMSYPKPKKHKHKKMKEVRFI
jgi:hypothetical protein